MPDLRDTLFTIRSYTPIPFLALGLIFGEPVPASLAAGLAVSLVGEGIRLWAVGHAGSETRVTGSVGASRLVVTGPYAHMRNPLYTGNILLYTGFAVMANIFWLIPLALVWFVFQYAMIISREEEFLWGKFGSEYAAYTAAVPRLFFRVTAYRKEDGTSFDLSRAVRSERRTFQAFLIGVLLMAAKMVIWG
jgi:protein-S-isoprenylcysteine O-methyltransferase Ste14